MKKLVVCFCIACLCALSFMLYEGAYIAKHIQYGSGDTNVPATSNSDDNEDYSKDYFLLSDKNLINVFRIPTVK